VSSFFLYPLLLHSLGTLRIFFKIFLSSSFCLIFSFFFLLFYLSPPLMTFLPLYPSIISQSGRKISVFEIFSHSSSFFIIFFLFLFLFNLSPTSPRAVDPDPSSSYLYIVYSSFSILYPSYLFSLPFFPSKIIFYVYILSL